MELFGGRFYYNRIKNIFYDKIAEKRAYPADMARATKMPIKNINEIIFSGSIPSYDEKI